MKNEITFKEINGKKILKLRDGEHKGEMVKFDFNTRYLTLENDILEGTGKL